MSFPVMRDTLNTIVPPSAVLPSNPDQPKPDEPLSQSEIEANKVFVASRVEDLSKMILDVANSGLKSHIINIFRKPLLPYIAAGLQVNFPDSKVTTDMEQSTITVDWS